MVWSTRDLKDWGYNNSNMVNSQIRTQSTARAKPKRSRPIANSNMVNSMCKTKVSRLIAALEWFAHTATLPQSYKPHAGTTPPCCLIQSQSSRRRSCSPWLFSRFSLLEVLGFVEALGSPELAEPPMPFAPLEPDALPVEPEVPGAPVEP